MKTILKSIAVLSVFVAAQAFAIPVSGAKLTVLNQFKSKAEPTAKDALWTSETMFKVGVLDNGSDRYLYAQYVCDVLAENGIKGVSVQIIDIVKLVRTNKWVKLGENHCK